jgi:hypothetical protein
MTGDAMNQTNSVVRVALQSVRHAVPQPFGDRPRQLSSPRGARTRRRARNRNGKAFELPDGTLLVADQGTGGHTTADAKSMSLRLLRVRIRPDHSGIDLLPASSR